MTPPSKDKDLVEGAVKLALPGLKFQIEVEGLPHLVLGYIAGKMRTNRIRVLTGDRVTLKLAPDRKLGRIVRRL